MDAASKGGASQGSQDRAPAIGEDKSSKDPDAKQKPKCAQCGKQHGGICQGDQYKRQKGNNKKQGERLLLASTNLVNDNPMDTTTVPATLTYRNNSIDVRALIDTGALHANYINEETARKMQISK